MRKKKDNSECVGFNLFYIYSIFIKNVTFFVFEKFSFSCFVFGKVYIHMADTVLTPVFKLHFKKDTHISA